MGLVLTDYPVYRATANGKGASTPLEMDCSAVPSGSLWRVDQVACVIFPGPNVLSFPPLVTLYDIASPGPTAVPIQSTMLAPYPDPAGNADADAIDYWADWDAEAGPFTIQGGNQLAIVFNAVPLEAVAAIRVQYGLFQGTPGAATPVAGAQPNPVSPAI